MSDPLFKSWVEGGVARIVLDNPERHNAFDDRLISGLTTALREHDANPDVRVVVLAGNGKSFSAGADLNWMRRAAGYSREENYADALKLAELMDTLDRLSKPTIARVHGAAIGGGVGLVACCDIVLAAEAAVFCLSEVKLGIIPAAISPYVVNAIGTRHARRYFVTAERFDATEAARIGLVHEVVPNDALDARLDELLTQLAGNGPQAMAASKDLARVVGNSAVAPETIQETARRIAAARASAEGREGIDAFLNKRKPMWVK